VTFITRNGIVLRTGAEGISRFGRSTQGVILLNLDKGDTVAALSVEQPDHEANGNGNHPDDDLLIMTTME